MKVSRDSRDATWLVQFARGKYIDTLRNALDNFEISDDKVIEEKLAQLFFLSPYQTLFEIVKVALPTRIRALQEPTDQGNLLLANLTSTEQNDFNFRHTDWVGHEDYKLFSKQVDCM